MPVIWEKAAKAIVETEKAKRGWGNRELVEALERIGVSINEHAITQKLNNGKFPVTFLLQCLEVMEVEVIQVGELLRLHQTGD